jgi:DNA-binding CsgD family transcriptional regulator
VVLFGDVVASRRAAVAATSWLRTLTAELSAAYAGGEQLAPFEFTQGDEIQGLLTPIADPTRAVVRASLHPERRPMRWTIVRGAVDPGTGPATQRSGPAFIAARERLALAASRRELLAAATGDAATDALLDGVAPVLGELLGDLTDRQREIAWPILVDGLRQSEAAAQLGVSRATVSVAADRAHLRSIEELARVVRTLVARSAPVAEGVTA